MQEHSVRIPYEIDLDAVAITVAERLVNLVAHKMTYAEAHHKELPLPKARSQQPRLLQPTLISATAGRVPEEMDKEKTRRAIILTTELSAGEDALNEALILLDVTIHSGRFAGEVNLERSKALLLELPAKLDAEPNNDRKYCLLSDAWSFIHKRLGDWLDSDSRSAVFPPLYETRHMLDTDYQKAKSSLFAIVSKLDSAGFKKPKEDYLQELTAKWLD